MKFKKPIVIAGILILAIILIAVIRAEAKSKSNQGKSCKNGDGSLAPDGTNWHDQNNNVVGCHNGTWGAPN